MTEYRLNITVISSKPKEYKPITFAVAVPETLAKMLMATPVGSVSLGIELKGHILDKSRFLDFK